MATRQAALKRMLMSGLLVLMLITPAHADNFLSRDLAVIGDAMKSVPEETKEMLRYPVDHSSEFLKYASSIGALILVDKPVTQFYQDHVEEPMKGFHLAEAPAPFDKAGSGGTDGWLVLSIGGTYLSGVLTNSTKTQKVGIAATKAIGYSLILDQVALKTLAGRKRPSPSLSSGQTPSPFTSNPYDFFYSRDGEIVSSSPKASSFASYHFTMWFSVAKVYQRAYNNYWVPYSLATLGLASNIKGHRHWVSDMVAGAMLGTLIGNSIANQTFSDNGSAGEISLTAPPNGEPGLEIVYRF